jgi:hypothetical protein
METEKGLFWYSLFFLFLLFVVYKELTPFFFIGYFIWSAIFIVFLLWWFVKRNWYSYWSNKLYVVFAVTIDYEDEKLYKTYKELINNFREKLKDYKLSQDIKVIKKPVDIKFSDHSAAESKTKLNTLCSTLIISGLPITSKEEMKFKFNFHYEFKYYGDKSKEKYYKEIFNKKIDKALSRKSWTIRDNIKSKESIYMSAFNASTYILSLCMGSLGEADEAIKLLQPTRDECNQNINKKEYGPLIAEVRNYLYKINEIKFNVSYCNLKVEELKPLADEMERLEKNEYVTYMAKAIVYELDNNRNKAREYTQKAENFHPKGIYDFKFNYLYFNLTEGRYSDAVRILDEMQGLIDERNIIPIINFLYNKYERTNNLAILFNIGAVTLIWGEIKLGKRELNRFIRKTKSSNNYDVLLNKSYELLNKYNK